LRRQLEVAVLAGRRAAESASRAALEGLGVFGERRPEHLNAEQAALRKGLRAKWRQLGGDRELLVAECAYEQWHRLLFARFLAENGLLLHPLYRAPVTLEECEELAGELGEPDGWSVAARFAAEILPGIFRLDDPCVRLRLAPEGRHALEQVLAGLPVEVFEADDALGWVYQFWQKDKKDEVNASERKIGGADLGPVTQLFTESYMVRFLLENSLGAWWASLHPDSRLVTSFEYLRFDEEGKPAAGSFEGWPERVADVTVMDPCCGSGHFVVEAFSMLWQMRVEEEGLGVVEAQDAVLRDNLFGLELDPRCVQIAMFAVALQAWKAGGAWRQLPVPNIACSGIPVKAPVEEWKSLAGGDQRLESALERLHLLFANAEILGSLMDPTGTAERTRTRHGQSAFDDASWTEVAHLLGDAIAAERTDPAAAVVGADAAGAARAAEYLSREYTLVATNVPYLGAQRMVPVLAGYLEARFPSSSWDLATAFIERALQLTPRGAVALVTPLGWLFLRNYSQLRKKLLAETHWNALALLGEGAFTAIGGAVVKTALVVLSQERDGGDVVAIDAGGAPGAAAKADLLRDGLVVQLDQRVLVTNPDTMLALSESAHDQLDRYATSWQGLVTGDNSRYMVRFWEVSEQGRIWERFLTAPQESSAFTGRSTYLRWEGGQGSLVECSGAHNFNPKDILSRRGVAVGQSTLGATLYEGEFFNDAASPLIPIKDEWLPAIWAFARSSEYRDAVRQINRTIKVGVGYLIKVPFDLERWRQVAAEAGSLPEPSSNDPTQWLFAGRPDMSAAPLHVAVARLLGYRWPGQGDRDDLDGLADADGIVCLPSVAGEATASDRLHRALATAFDGSLSPSKLNELLEQAGSKKKNLADWLRDDFFKQHCALFGNRPFIWHVWDGQREGFAALVNYHRLDRKTLEKLTYTYLGQDWVERQRAGVRDGVAGADVRLAAALGLQHKLELILGGEAPYDIYVRWKELNEQPVGWEPDLNDGVRLNIRPFVEANVLRASFNIHWKKDRGKNPDGSERHNDIHVFLTQKLAARGEAGGV
jgi:hypothetical protein